LPAKINKVAGLSPIVNPLALQQASDGLRDGSASF
jgi:hypothetical protein